MNATAFTTTATADRRPVGRRPVRRTAFLVAFLVATLVASGASVVNAPAASAHTPHPTNGCSNVPDRPYGFGFKASCDKHDVCYGHAPYGRSAVGRERCDSVFYADLAAWCRSRLTNNAGWYNTWSGYGWKYLFNPQTTCLDTAAIYWQGVRRFGCHAFWRDGQSFYASCAGR